jgi:hypothetical protein
MRLEYPENVIQRCEYSGSSDEMNVVTGIACGQELKPRFLAQTQLPRAAVGDVSFTSIFAGTVNKTFLTYLLYLLL